MEGYYRGIASSHAVALDQTDEIGSYEKVQSDKVVFPNSSIDSERVARNCRELGSGSRFLDIGAGYGLFSHSAMQHGFQVTAIEPTEICRKVYRLMNGFELLRGMVSDEWVKQHIESFDVVLMSLVLEHISDIETTLRSFATLLSTNGIVAIAVPHFRSWLSCAQRKNDMFIMPPEHFNYFTKAGLVALFRRHGFSCARIHTVSRINAARVTRKLAIPVFGKIASKTNLGVMKLSDSVNGGMFFNAYFRKEGSWHDPLNSLAASKSGERPSA